MSIFLVVLHLIDPPASTTAGIITATAAAITACSLLVTSVALLLSNRKVRVQSAETAQAVEKVHVIVNQSSTDQKRLIAALTNALVNAGVEVPYDQSLYKAPTPPPLEPPVV